MEKERRNNKVRLGVLPINRDIIRCYLVLLGMTKGQLLDRMIDLRSRKNGKPGPDASTLDRALRNGYASSEVYALILNVLQEAILAAYNTGTFTRDEVPMLICLFVWPSKRLRDKYYVRAICTRSRRAS
jgi:hypothetical protein